MDSGYEITTYIQSSNLLYDITDDHYFFDLILLDIEMPDISGMDIAERIKPYLSNVKIIFITSHLEYVIDAFELSIFRYVPKNNSGQRLRSDVTDAAKLIELESDKEYIIQTAGNFEKIPYKDIIYIQRDGGKNSIICSSIGQSKVRKSLHQIFEELDTPNPTSRFQSLISYIMKAPDHRIFTGGREFSSSCKIGSYRLTHST